MNTSCLPKGTRLVGRVAGPGDLRVEGVLEGEVDIDGELVVAPGAWVEGRIRALRARVQGQLSGEVQCREAILVASTGALVGEAVAPKVQVDAGGHLQGRVVREAPVERPARSKTAASRRAPSADSPSEEEVSSSARPASLNMPRLGRRRVARRGLDAHGSTP